ncbi:hypothetical protein IKI14_04015 [bacterium]|nr:hypothetical protein [bacterium]
MYLELHTGAGTVIALQSALQILPSDNIVVHADPGSHSSPYSSSSSPSPHRVII